MASTRIKTTKDGRRFYEIRVNMGRDKPQLASRWYVPDGWSQKAIDREIAKVAAEFERQCKSGEVISREEHKRREAEAAAAAANLSAADSISGMKRHEELEKMMNEWEVNTL